MEMGEKQRGEQKVARNRIPIVEEHATAMRKPEWLRVKAPFDPKVKALKAVLRENQLHSVCEEASCPNLGECFSHGTATFMILGDLCTRRCPFCDVAHGRPQPPDANEPKRLASVIKKMGLSYVVITSVDRDDLKDGGAQHFVDCIRVTREHCPEIKIEILVPDFRGRMDKALDCFVSEAPDVFNHNLETVPRLYPQARPGADYEWSLKRLKEFKRRHPQVLTKSGLMLGLGEEKEEVIEVMRDLHAHRCDMLTLGQYLQPSKHHLPVQRFVPPQEFDELYDIAIQLGFASVASGPLVRSSYHADQQAKEITDNQ